jgi:nuclear transport factor 2 (NTF2) superfamily protein
MKIRSAIALVGLAISFGGPTFAQQKDTLDPQKRAALVAFERNEMEAWNSNDAQALAATFTEDAVLVTNTGPIYGREDIEKYYKDLFQKMHFSNYLISIRLILQVRLAKRTGRTENGA